MSTKKETPKNMSPKSGRTAEIAKRRDGFADRAIAAERTSSSSGKNGSSEPSANELTLKAWEKTYANRGKARG